MSRACSGLQFNFDDFHDAHDCGSAFGEFLKRLVFAADFVIANESPDNDALAACEKLGAALA